MLKMQSGLDNVKEMSEKQSSEFKDNVNVIIRWLKDMKEREQQGTRMNIRGGNEATIKEEENEEEDRLASYFNMKKIEETRHRRKEQVGQLECLPGSGWEEKQSLNKK